MNMEFDPARNNPAQPGLISGERSEHLLTLINAELAALNFTGKWVKLPDFPGDLPALQNKRIVIADDGDRVLQNYLPYLITATGGAGSAVWFNACRDGFRSFLDAILKKNPEVVLLDYGLGMSLKGSDVAKAIKEQAPHIIVVGFSGESHRAAEFMAAGADAAIEKTANPEKDLRRLNEVLIGLRAPGGV